MCQENILKIIRENPGIRQVVVRTQYGADSMQILSLVRKNMIRREWIDGRQGYKLWSNDGKQNPV